MNLWLTINKYLHNWFGRSFILEGAVGRVIVHTFETEADRFPSLPFDTRMCILSNKHHKYQLRWHDINFLDDFRGMDLSKGHIVELLTLSREQSLDKFPELFL